MQGKSKVSILMGIYNCADTLSDAIDSILKQTYVNWELILCDDGSQDDTYQVASKYKEKYPDKIILLKNKKNIRLAATLNHCAKHATGKYIARMDGDDLSLPDRFEKQVDFLDRHPEYALIGTYMKAFDEKGEKNIIPIKEIPVKTDLPKFNPFHHATIMMKREVFEALEGYRVSKLTTRAEDVDLWFRFFANGYKGYNIAEPLYLVREDVATFNRRTFKHSLEASRVLVHGIKLLKLPLQYYVFAIKPIVSQITPIWLKRKFRKNMDNRNRKGD